jgi:uncharacterized protein YkwD
MTPRLRRARLAAVGAVVALTLGAAPAAHGVSVAGATSHPSISIPAYDHVLLVEVNAARIQDRRHSYESSTRLAPIAHAWAKHLANHGALEHNPNLVKDVTKVCPDWTTLGENVGYSFGSNAHELFSAYMHSPPHKANILDSHYKMVSIQTYTVVRHGQVEQWNVMDFANHCG